MASSATSKKRHKHNNAHASPPPCLSLHAWRHVIEHFALPPRHAELVALLLQGKQDKEIAKAMQLAMPTVRTYLDRIRQRMGAHDRVGVVIAVFSVALQAQSDECLRRTTAEPAD